MNCVTHAYQAGVLTCCVIMLSCCHVVMQSRSARRMFPTVTNPFKRSEYRMEILRLREERKEFNRPVEERAKAMVAKKMKKHGYPQAPGGSQQQGGGAGSGSKWCTECKVTSHDTAQWTPSVIQPRMLTAPSRFLLKSTCNPSASPSCGCGCRNDCLPLVICSGSRSKPVF